jgi:hypothetical protein
MVSWLFGGGEECVMDVEQLDKCFDTLFDAIIFPESLRKRQGNAGLKVTKKWQQIKDSVTLWRKYWRLLKEDVADTQFARDFMADEVLSTTAHPLHLYFLARVCLID